MAPITKVLAFFVDAYIHEQEDGKAENILNYAKEEFL